MINENDYGVKLEMYRAFESGNPIREKDMLNHSLTSYSKNHNLLDDFRLIYAKVHYDRVIYQRALIKEKKKLKSKRNNPFVFLNVFSKKRKSIKNMLELVNSEIERINVEYDHVQHIYNESLDLITSLNNKLTIINEIPDKKWSEFEGLNMALIDISKFKSKEDIELYYQSLEDEYAMEYLAELQSDATYYEVDCDGTEFVGQDELEAYRKEIREKHKTDIERDFLMLQNKEKMKKEHENFVKPLINKGLTLDEIYGFMINRELII